MIIRSAIKLHNLIFSVKKPGRHCDVIKIMNEHGVKPHLGIQGFLLENGEFVDRIQGAIHAIECGQIKKLKTPPDLFSEDLW